MKQPMAKRRHRSCRIAGDEFGKSIYFGKNETFFWNEKDLMMEFINMRLDAGDKKGKTKFSVEAGRIGV